MKNTNTNTNTSFFKKVGFVLLFSIFAFSNYWVKGQIYRPLNFATTFYATNNTTATDLHFDYDWNRNFSYIVFNNTDKSIQIKPNATSERPWVETTPLILSGNDSFSFFFRLTNMAGGSSGIGKKIVLELVDTFGVFFKQIDSIDVTNASQGDFNVKSFLTDTGVYRVRLVYRTNNDNPTLSIWNFVSSTIPTVLPVTYSSLSAKPLANGVKIEWTTTNEENNSYFEVERTNDGDNWLTLGTVEGNGTTYAQSSYEYMDNNPAQGLNVYRLKQVDWNGDYEYSSNKTVVWGGEIAKNAVQIFPNPSANTIQITGVEKPKVTVYSMAGVVMLEAENTNHLDIQNLLRGVYFIQVQDAAGEVSRIRFLKD